MSLTSPSATSRINQLQQLGVDGLPGLLQHPDQLAGLPDVPRSEEGVGGAFVVAAGRAADAVDVVLRRVGVVVIDDELDVLHVWTRRCEGTSRGDGRDRSRSQNNTNTGWGMNLVHS